MKLKHALKNIDKGLLFMTIFMFGFGLLNIVTSSSREAVLVNRAGVYFYFYRQIAILGVSAVASVFFFTFPTKSYKSLWVFPYALALILCFYCFFQSAKRGAQNWIPIGSFQFQPSELAKPAIILALAALIDNWANELKNPNIDHRKMIGAILFVAFAIPGMIFLQKDFGSASIIAVIAGTLFLACPIPSKEKFRTIVLLGGLAIVAGSLLLATKGEIFSKAQMSRLNYFNPCSKYETSGYQVCNAYIAFNDGGVFGLGIGKSKQKYSYIPEPHTDSIFAIIGEEWGVLKSLVFVFIPYAIILYRITEIAAKATTVRGRFIALGVAISIFIHIFLNLGGLFAVIPLTGVPLPFLSYGGTYTLGLALSLTMVQRVAYETKTRKIKI